MKFTWKLTLAFFGFALIVASPLTYLSAARWTFFVGGFAANCGALALGVALGRYTGRSRSRPSAAAARTEADDVGTTDDPDLMFLSGYTDRSLAPRLHEPRVFVRGQS